MSETNFESADTSVAIDEAGGVLRVGHTGRPLHSYLQIGWPAGTRWQGSEETPLQLRRTRCVIDLDEVELGLEDRSGLTVTIRHTFVGGWRTRCLLANDSASLLTLRLRWPWIVRDPAVGWAVAQGAEAELFVHPGDDRSPLLRGRLRQGSVSEITGAGVRLPEIVLLPGGRYVLAWDWSWLPEAAAYARGRSVVQPAATTLVRGDTASIAAGPDVAIVIPSGIAVERDDDSYELTAYEARSSDVELRSARGLRTIRMEWTRSPGELLAGAADALLSGRRGRIGVVVLPDLLAAVVVQHALAADLLDAPDDAADALDLFAARFDPDPIEPDPIEPGPSRQGLTDRALTVLYLCAEHERTGDAELLALAADQVVRSKRPEPGLGIAATRLCAALVAAGSSPQTVMDHLLGLLWSPLPAVATTADLTTRTELLAVTQHAPGARRSEKNEQPGSVADELRRAVLVLGAELGSGLPGLPIRPLPVDLLGQLLATFVGLPDSLADPTRRAWGVPAPDLAARSTPVLISRLDGQPLQRAHVWLALVASAG